MFVRLSPLLIVSLQVSFKNASFTRLIDKTEILGQLELALGLCVCDHIATPFSAVDGIDLKA